MWCPCRASPAAAPRFGRNTPSGCPGGIDRDGFAAALKAQGIPTAIYYPKSMHQQTAYRDFPVADGGLPVSEKLSRGRHQPADARLSRRADPGADHQGCAGALRADLPFEGA